MAAARDGAPRFPMPVQVLRVDDIAWVGIGAEVFFETGLAIKERSPLAHTQVLGFSAGCRCYLPRAEDYPDGGWDIDARYAVPDLFFQAYSMPVALRPDSADRVTEAALELLRETAVG